jgi:hypothetical protein
MGSWSWLLVPIYPDTDPAVGTEALNMFRRLLPEWNVLGVDASLLYTSMEFRKGPHAGLPRGSRGQPAKRARFTRISPLHAAAASGDGSVQGRWGIWAAS